MKKIECIIRPEKSNEFFSIIEALGIKGVTLSETKEIKEQRSSDKDPTILEMTKIEISVLSLPKSIKDIKEIEIGKHGIIISKGPCKGLLLPQVPVEWNWDLETYLSHGCLKAGLDEDEWKKGVDIEIFSAQVFSE